MGAEDMRHLRSDYNRIQDPAGKIGADEPVFLLRAQDDAFPMMLAVYALHQREVGNEALAQFIENQIPTVHAWRRAHPTKEADIPSDVAPGLATAPELASLMYTVPRG